MQSAAMLADVLMLANALMTLAILATVAGAFFLVVPCSWASN